MTFISIEPLLKIARINRIMPYFPSGGVLVDVGCDNPPVLINKVKKQMDFCIGVDSEAVNGVVGNVELKKCFLKKKIHVESELANVVTALAVLEHLDYPRAIIMEFYRILKPGGMVLMTVPSPRNEKLLNFLALFGIVSKKMIEQHKHYFTASELTDLFTEAGFRSVTVSLFQSGLNTLVRAVK